MEQDMIRGRIRLAIKHDGLKLVGVGETAEYNFGMVHKLNDPTPIFVIRHLATEMRVYNVHLPSLSDFKPVDAVSHVTLDQPKDINDLLLFAPSPVSAQEIVVAERDVSDILDELLKRQQPDQAAIRHRMRMDQSKMVREGLRGDGIEPMPRLTTHANIVAFAAASG